MALIWLLIQPLVFANDCVLIDSDAAKPSPSLVKCYRFNKLACCISAHDQQILSDYEEFMSASCQREYDNLEDYFCFACQVEQSDYVDVVNQELYFCESYAETVWGGSLDKNSDEYDDCGMYSYWRDETTTIVPSLEWNNGYEFFAEVKPPYFENYTIIIVGDDDDHDCFNSASVLAALAWVVAVIG